MKSKLFTKFFISSFLCLIFIQPANPCGYYEDESDYRAMMFRALLPGMKSMQPFFYTMDLYYNPNDDLFLNTDPDETDRYRNCSEWLAICDKTVQIEDVYQIQYRTNGNLFANVYNTNSWEENFDKNTFIRFLTQKGNKDLLEYMLFAKKIELTESDTGGSRFEKWDDEKDKSVNYSYTEYQEKDIKNQKIKNELLEVAWKKLNETKNPFLQKRYAFQVCRLRNQVNPANSEIKNADVYGNYFGNVHPDNLMSIWAGLFQAVWVSPESSDRYRYLIRVFAHSQEKKFRSVQLFNTGYDSDSLTQNEKSLAEVMILLRNSGKVLENIESAYTLYPENPYIPFLILREINKLEDWLITPVFFGKYSYSNDDPFRCAYTWLKPDAESAELQAANLAADMKYIAALKKFLKILEQKATGETKDFYAISLAHLSLLEENPNEARYYLSRISSKANASIQLQKKLETIWLAVKTQDIHSSGFKKIFLDNIEALENISTSYFNKNQLLYTLTLSLANAYFQKGDCVYGNLMRMKSDIYRYAESDWHSSYKATNDYALIEYFDKNARISDLDELIAILDKKNKTPYEQYLCNQPTGSIDAYKELKGTMAFRNNNLPLAYETFASMPADYWQSAHFSFASFLNEDPFIPKGLQAYKCRKFDYEFNKAAFVKELLELQKQLTEKNTDKADVYIRLGNAYFNTSYWGNAWMMMRYSSSVGDVYYSKIDCLPEWMRNYMTAGIARTYYEKALQEAVNDEQRAYASLMLYHIHHCGMDYKNTDEEKQIARKYIDQFMWYKKTQIFRMYECPGIKFFLSSK